MRLRQWDDEMVSCLLSVHWIHECNPRQPSHKPLIQKRISTFCNGLDLEHLPCCCWEWRPSSAAVSNRHIRVCQNPDNSVTRRLKYHTQSVADASLDRLYLLCSATFCLWMPLMHRIRYRIPHIDYACALSSICGCRRNTSQQSRRP